MTIIYLAAAWLVGLWLASVTAASSQSWLVLGISSLGAALLLGRFRQPRAWLLGLAFLSLGAARYAAAQPNIDPGRVAYYNGREQVLVTGLVAGEPERNERDLQFHLRAETLALDDYNRQEVEGLVLVTTPLDPRIRYGTRLQAAGRLESPPQGTTFDYAAYLARRGINSAMNRPEITILAPNQGSPVYQNIYRLKDRARQTIDRLLPDPQGALLAGILLGDDSQLPAELADQFRTTGLTHIIAISGFNMAILAGILLALGRPLFGQRWSGWFALAGIALYTLLVGAGASVVRAAIMAGLFIIAARLLGRPTFAPAGLFTAAILMTLANPFTLWDVGFQLSFAATLGLMLYVGPWANWLENRLQGQTGPENGRQAARLVSEILLSTLAAMLLTLPLIMVHFGQLSLVSPLANLFALPAQPAVMTWGGLATVAGLFFEPMGQALAWVAWLFLTYTIGVVRLFARLPAAAVPVTFHPAAAFFSYGLIFSLTWLNRQSPEERRIQLGRLAPKKPWRLILAGGGLAAILALAFALSQPDGQLHVVFLDVGQGDATFIQTPGGRQILIDGGPHPTVLAARMGAQMPFWDRELDLVVATHSDGDHVGGLTAAFDHYRVGRLLTNGQEVVGDAYEALRQAAEANGTSIDEVRAGQTLILDEAVALEVLGPIQPPMDVGDNDSSAVLRLVYGDFSLLLTGDIGQAAESDLLASGREVQAVVYKAGHHGAKTSSSAAFLAAVSPQFIVISAGSGNRFGHPHPDVLQRAAEIGATVLRTDELNNIELI
ncbi:MAG: DNA internalization-related competence protein ComEC/Rec2, partial [Candidatus Promineifilaceae bacterium]